jgi:hypothetical protein
VHGDAHAGIARPHPWPGGFSSCLRPLATKGGALKRWEPASSVYQTFERAGMYRIFAIHASKGEAVEKHLRVARQCPTGPRRLVAASAPKMWSARADETG